MNFACPNCNMFQVAGFTFYGNCQHCGWSFSDTKKAQSTLKDDVHIASLANIIAQKDRRIAELEAELAMAKVREKNLRERIVCADDVRMHTVVQGVAVQSATDFEEGEG